MLSSFVSVFTSLVIASSLMAVNTISCQWLQNWYVQSRLLYSRFLYPSVYLASPLGCLTDFINGICPELNSCSPEFLWPYNSCSLLHLSWQPSIIPSFTPKNLELPLTVFFFSHPMSRQEMHHLFCYHSDPPSSLVWIPATASGTPGFYFCFITVCFQHSSQINSFERSCHPFLKTFQKLQFHINYP